MTIRSIQCWWFIFNRCMCRRFFSCCWRYRGLQRSLQMIRFQHLHQRARQLFRQTIDFLSHHRVVIHFGDNLLQHSLYITIPIGIRFCTILHRLSELCKLRRHFLFPFQLSLLQFPKLLLKLFLTQQRLLQSIDMLTSTALYFDRHLLHCGLHTLRSILFIVLFRFHRFSQLRHLILHFLHLRCELVFYFRCHRFSLQSLLTK
mmetsp:Transcript_34974/g.57090  ORF Transcript_34974/g.57090 Transcript_34974/m.57090 type:complete len:203 (+) Transcript_34974:175-783(+)